jgi:hypothetical protein
MRTDSLGRKRYRRINIQLVRIKLVISVDREHGTGIGHITPAATTYPVTQVGHTTVLAMYKKLMSPV